MLIENLIDPTVLFFGVGLLAGTLRVQLRLPEAVYEMLSIYLLLAIGLKGGEQLAASSGVQLLLPVLGTIFLGVCIPLLAYQILRRLGKLDRADAAAIAAHYGSVSAVTYAVVLSFLDRLAVPYEGYTSVLLVVLEIPAIAVAILIARLRASKVPVGHTRLLHEVFLNKGVFLLLVGMLVGAVAGDRLAGIRNVFFDPFKGMLTLFLFEMGIIVAHRLSELKRVGVFLIGFGVVMPLLSATLGILTGMAVGLSLGGTVVLATLAASASYIAAPAAVRLAIPEANPTLYLTASLGITFPFNIAVGIPLYYELARLAYRLGGG